MKHFLLIFILLFIPYSLIAAHDNLSKSKGTTQEVIAELYPIPAQTNVPLTATVSVRWTLPLDTKHIKKHDIKLRLLSPHEKHHGKHKKKHKQIKGHITYDETDQKLLFTPDEKLIAGLYEVEIKSLKVAKAHKKTKIKEIKYRFIVVEDTTPPLITLNGDATITLFLGQSYRELHATAVDERDGIVDVTVSASVDTSTLGTYTITYNAIDSSGNKATATRTITVVEPKLISLSLEGATTNINLGDVVNLMLVATYEDNTTKNIKENIELLVTPKDSLETNGTTIVAKKEGSVTLRAKVDNTLSNTLNFEIKWVVDGHTLPPKPDKALNDSTLLGIDSNDNGVRDDVERWIYETYKDKHPIHIDIAMQAGRAWQKVLEDPSKAKEIHQIINASSDCEVYYQIYAKYFNEPMLVGSDITTRYFIHKVIFNTQKRNDAFLQYNSLLSGNFYALTKVGDRKKRCDFNTTKYEE